MSEKGFQLLQPNEIVIELSGEGDVLKARKAGREMARGLGFGLAHQTRLATAISELVRNVIDYAGDGTCTITTAGGKDTRRIEVKVEDRGPGIDDIDRVMRPGFSTRIGLGAGLWGAQLLADEFSIQSRPGKTVVIIGMSPGE